MSQSTAMVMSERCLHCMRLLPNISMSCHFINIHTQANRCKDDLIKPLSLGRLRLTRLTRNQMVDQLPGLRSSSSSSSSSSSRVISVVDFCCCCCCSFFFFFFFFFFFVVVWWWYLQLPFALYIISFLQVIFNFKIILPNFWAQLFSIPSCN